MCEPSPESAAERLEHIHHAGTDIAILLADCWLPGMTGVFAVGDVRHRSVKRVASAVGEGSMAVQYIHQYLLETAKDS